MGIGDGMAVHRVHSEDLFTVYIQRVIVCDCGVGVITYTYVHVKSEPYCIIIVAMMQPYYSPVSFSTAQHQSAPPNVSILYTRSFYFLCVMSSSTLVL